MYIYYIISCCSLVLIFFVSEMVDCYQYTYAICCRTEPSERARECVPELLRGGDEGHQGGGVGPLLRQRPHLPLGLHNDPPQK